MSKKPKANPQKKQEIHALKKRIVDAAYDRSTWRSSVNDTDAARLTHGERNHATNDPSENLNRLFNSMFFDDVTISGSGGFPAPGYQFISRVGAAANAEGIATWLVNTRYNTQHRSNGARVERRKKFDFDFRDEWLHGKLKEYMEDPDGVMDDMCAPDPSSEFVVTDFLERDGRIKGYRTTDVCLVLKIDADMPLGFSQVTLTPNASDRDKRLDCDIEAVVRGTRLFQKFSLWSDVDSGRLMQIYMLESVRETDNGCRIAPSNDCTSIYLEPHDAHNRHLSDGFGRVVIHSDGSVDKDGDRLAPDVEEALGHMLMTLRELEEQAHRSRVDASGHVLGENNVNQVSGPPHGGYSL